MLYSVKKKFLRFYYKFVFEIKQKLDFDVIFLFQKILIALTKSFKITKSKRGNCYEL